MDLEWTDPIPLTESGVAGINAIAGVYRLMYYDTNKEKRRIYYVGQTKDLNKRLSDHLPSNETKKCCKEYLKEYDCYFRAAGISKADDRDGAEVALYNRFKPPCVDKIPDVDPIEINFS